MEEWVDVVFGKKNRETDVIGLPNYALKQETNSMKVSFDLKDPYYIQGIEFRVTLEKVADANTTGSSIITDRVTHSCLMDTNTGTFNNEVRSKLGNAEIRIRNNQEWQLGRNTPIYRFKIEYFDHSGHPFRNVSTKYFSITNGNAKRVVVISRYKKLLEKLVHYSGNDRKQVHELLEQKITGQESFPNARGSQYEEHTQNMLQQYFLYL